MSSLSNQLSALTSHAKGFAHSPSAAAGIGRGFHHSSKHGHSILAGSGDIGGLKRKPSILYENAREAANIPLVVLRENAVRGLNVLKDAVEDAYGVDNTSMERYVTMERLLDVHSLSFERGTSTPAANKEVDGSIAIMLKFLTTMMGECPPPSSGDADFADNPILIPCLQIIEYLIRRYDVHSRSDCASLLIASFLPLQLTYGTAYPQLFPRVLGLVDLQSAGGGMWSFLRPFAAAESPPFNRISLSKGVARDEALFTLLAGMGKDTMDLLREEVHEFADGNKMPTRRGISIIFSFTASILIEALHIQSKTGAGARASVAVSGVQEGFVRKIFPVIIAACGGGRGAKGSNKLYSSEWKEWGRLLASTLAMLCPLSEVVRDALCDAVVSGMPMPHTSKICFNYATEVDDWMDSSMCDDELDDASSAIMTLLSILGSNSLSSKKKNSEEEWKYYLPLHPSNKGTVDYLGCDLSASTYKILSMSAMLPVVASAIGAVLDSLSEDDDDNATDSEMIGKVGPLLGAIIMNVFGKMEKEAKKDPKQKKGRENQLGFDGDLLLLLSLVKEPSLKALWEAKDGSMVAALGVQTVVSYDRLCEYLNSSECDEEKRSMISRRYKAILEELSKLNPSICDRGIAFAIDYVTSKSRKDSSNSVRSQERLSSLALILGHADAFDAAQKKMNSKGKSSGVSTGDASAAAFLLPPRVALEHADAAVRMSALASLNKMEVVSMESDLGTALLRRLSTDDNAAVIVATGEVLTGILNHYLTEDGADDCMDNLDSLAEAALAALFRWTVIGRDDAWSSAVVIDGSKSAKIKDTDDSGLLPLLTCLKICGLVAKIIWNTTEIDDDNVNSTAHLFYVTVLSLAAHIHHVNKGSTGKISKTATLALSQISDSKAKISSFEDFLYSDDTCHGIIQYCYDTEGIESRKITDVPDLIRKRFVWLALSTILGSVPSPPQPKQKLITLVVYQMKSYTKESKNSSSFVTESQQLSSSLQRCLSLIAANTKDELTNTMLQLVSVNSNVSFEVITKPAMAAFLDELAAGDSSGQLALIHTAVHPQAQKHSTLRLLTIAKEAFSQGKRLDSTELLLSTLSMLSHPDCDVRQQVMAVLENFKSVQNKMVSSVCTGATDKLSPTWSSMVMDGVNALPQLLGYIVTSSKSTELIQDYLIKGCASSAITDGSCLSKYGCHVAAVLLSAMEKAGELVFPLSKRWELAGKDLFNTLALVKPGYGEESLHGELRECVATMLKGVIVTDTQTEGQIISIGPSKSGRRVRSYSIGASESFRLLEPYPQSMIKALLQALAPASPKLLTDAVIQFALMRSSWASGVFPKLDKKSKQDILSALLALRVNKDNENAGKVCFNLPLKAVDFLYLLEDLSTCEVDQLAIVFILDVMRGKLEVLPLGKPSDIAKISSVLFEHLLSLSSTKNMDVGDAGGRDYTRVSILQTLLAIHSHYKDQLSALSHKHGSSGRKRSRSHSDVRSPSGLAFQAKILVGLVGGDLSSINPLHSARGKALSLSLLTCLCKESPSTVVTSLLPALASLDGPAVGDALSAIVPAFCSHAQFADLSLFDLLETFVAKLVTEGGKKRHSSTLLDQFANALIALPGKDGTDAVAAFITSVIALEAFNLQQLSSNDDDSARGPTEELEKSNILHVIANASSVMKVSVALSLLQYAEILMSVICGDSSSSDEVGADKMKVVELALFGPRGEKENLLYSDYSKAQKRSILYLTISLLKSVTDIISTPSARKLVRKSTGHDADLCLRLWQELMETDLNLLSIHAKQNHESLDTVEKKFWLAAPVVISECLESLQNLLPVSHFLASVNSILMDDSAEAYIKKKTIRVLTERVAEVNCDSPEHSLFLEMVPDLVAQLKQGRGATEGADREVLARIAIVRQQGVLVAIESFVSSLYPTSENSRSTNAASKVFLPALSNVSELFNKTLLSWSQKGSDGLVSDTQEAECQLLSSCALCISSLVKSLKARCLHLLPQIVKPLVSALKSINVAFRTGISNQNLTIFQLAILRTIATIAEILPGFLLSHLPLIFSNDALPTTTSQNGAGYEDNAVVAASKHLEISLATKTPVRQLVPCLSSALVKTLAQGKASGFEEACTLLRVMNIAIENVAKSDLTPVVGKVFNGLVTTYAHEGDEKSTTQLLLGANKCLLSLVMKLSEAQLRPLYARLREWRGNIDGNKGSSALSSRRYAFWSLSAELSKALKSIFFPCLTSVISDVIDELDIAVSTLCTKKKGGEAKRRRTDESDDVSMNVDAVKSLQPLLLCLEYALKADAHEGGDWTRGDDSQRYNMMLNHIGKLLLAQVPSNMTVLSDLSAGEQKTTSGYEILVQGIGSQEHGNVVGCLTALATAAGNEQLWKPLNFAVLEACGHRRSEVRKAGVSCLLSIIESIGEEYMVLLPECLPVLSELLEDGDEEIAGMARKCVREGEELLGESLEENLR